MRSEIIIQLMNEPPEVRFRYFMRLKGMMSKEEWKDAFRRVRFGIKTKFDIVEAFIEGNVEYDKKNKIILIGGKNGVEVNPSEYHLEMIEREALMDEMIEKYYTDEDAFKAGEEDEYGI